MAGPGGLIIAIDGPAGSGKSTVARRLAERLGLTLVDTGAIYRAVALLAVRRGVRLDDDAALGALVAGLPVSLEHIGGASRVLLGDEDVSVEIRTPAISLAASAVSARPVVRAGLLELQRRLGRQAERGAVMEGRDVGTVVFPDAPVKVFLSADPKVRAERRARELAGRGEPGSVETVEADQARRDEQDRTRAIAPLRPAEDAVLIDSTALSLDEVVARIEDLVRSRGL